MKEKTEQDFHIMKAFNGLADFLNHNVALCNMNDDCIMKLLEKNDVKLSSLYRIVDAIERGTNEKEQSL